MFGLLLLLFLLNTIWCCLVRYFILHMLFFFSMHMGEEKQLLY